MSPITEKKKLTNMQAAASTHTNRFQDESRKSTLLLVALHFNNHLKKFRVCVLYFSLCQARPLCPFLHFVAIRALLRHSVAMNNCPQRGVVTAFPHFPSP